MRGLELGAILPPKDFSESLEIRPARCSIRSRRRTEAALESRMNPLEPTLERVYAALPDAYLADRFSRPVYPSGMIEGYLAFVPFPRAGAACLRSVERLGDSSSR